MKKTLLFTFCLLSTLLVTAQTVVLDFETPESSSSFPNFGPDGYPGEVTFPVSATTYTVTAMETQDTRRFLEIEVNYGPGFWRFRFESDL